MNANQVLALTMRGIDKTLVADKLKRAVRQLQRWCDSIGDTFSGQPNPLQRADELIEAVQEQSENAALTLLAWLQIRLVDRRLKNAGSAEILLEIERISSELKAQTLTVLCERERARRANS